MSCSRHSWPHPSQIFPQVEFVWAGNIQIFIVFCQVEDCSTILWCLLLIYVLRKKGSKTKERMKEEEIEKGDCSRLPWKSLFMRFCRTENKRFTSDKVSKKKNLNKSVYFSQTFSLAWHSTFFFFQRIVVIVRDVSTRKLGPSSGCPSCRSAVNKIKTIGWKKNSVVGCSHCQSSVDPHALSMFAAW